VALTGSGPAWRPSRPGRLTVGAVVRATRLRLRWVVHTDEGAGRLVRWASTTELLDPGPYLKGGELVCSVGSMLTDDAACDDFVAALSRAGVSALCFGTGDVHMEIPPRLLRACQLAELPLIEAPRGAPFIAISEFLADSLVEAQVAVNRDRQQLVSRLLAAVRVRTPLEELLGVASQATDGRVEVAIDGDVQATQGDTSDVEISVPLAEAGTSLRWRGVADPPPMELLEQVGRVVDVARRELDIEAALGRERAGQLLDLVGNGLAHPVALRPLLAAQGIDTASMVASAWTPGAAALLVRHLPKAVVGEVPRLTIAVTERVDDVFDAASTLSLPCGYGSVASLADIGRSIAEARVALTLAERGHTPLGPDALTTVDGLLELQPTHRLQPFIDQIVQPLVDSDAARRTHHVDTLRTFLRLDGRLQATASEMFLHVNTVRHRLVQIHDITGRDPMVLADRMALMVALWAHDHQRPLSGMVQGWGRSTRP
jgi:hypothetical protein